MLNETKPGAPYPGGSPKGRASRLSYALSGIAEGIAAGRRTENTQ